MRGRTDPPHGLGTCQPIKVGPSLLLLSISARLRDRGRHATVGQNLKGKSEMKKIFAVILVTSLAGCAGDQYLASVSGFGEVTTAAVVMQKEQLEAFSGKQSEKIRSSLAEDRVDLRFTGPAMV